VRDQVRDLRDREDEDQEDQIEEQLAGRHAHRRRSRR
jgi:hypothetical protein